MTPLSPSHDDHAGLGRTDGPPAGPTSRSEGWATTSGQPASESADAATRTSAGSARGVGLGAERSPVLHLPDIQLPNRRDPDGVQPLRRALAGMRRVAAQAVRQRMSTEMSDLAGRIRKLHENDSR